MDTRSLGELFLGSQVKNVTVKNIFFSLQPFELLVYNTIHEEFCLYYPCCIRERIITVIQKEVSIATICLPSNTLCQEFVSKRRRICLN